MVMGILKEIIDLLQSSRKIVFVLTFGALLILLQNHFFQLFIIDNSIKTISCITFIIGSLFILWDIFFGLGRWFSNLGELNLTDQEFDILKILWISPDETLFLKREKISNDDLSLLKVVLSDLIVRNFIGEGYNNNYYLKSKGREALKKRLKK